MDSQGEPLARLLLGLGRGADHENPSIDPNQSNPVLEALRAGTSVVRHSKIARLSHA